MGKFSSFLDLRSTDWELWKSRETHSEFSTAFFFARSSGAELDAKENETRAASGCLLDNENIKTIREKSSALVVKKKEKKRVSCDFSAREFFIKFPFTKSFQLSQLRKLEHSSSEWKAIKSFYFLKYAK